jgi:DNA repair exonuclease SbcCD ATPase subunit
MYLYIKGFRTIQQYECEFQKESITLLSGPSGVGKTTIMNAIFWCLYGTLKNVRKFGTKTGVCMVKIHIGDVKITRTKSPESLLYEQENGLMLKDKEAQEKIVDLFGNVDIWLSCCYLRQGSRNKFMESSPSDRLTLLSELCFSSQSPDEYVEKISEKTKEITKEFEKQNDYYKRDLEIYQQKRREYPNYRKDILSDDQKKIYRQNISSTDIEELENTLSINERLESSYHSLLETANDLERKFPNYKNYLLDLGDKNILLEKIREDKSLGLDRILSQLDIEIKDLERQCVLLDTYETQYREMIQSMPNYMEYLSLNRDDENIDLLRNQIVNYEREWKESLRQKTNFENWTEQIKGVQDEIRGLKEKEEIEILLNKLSKRIEKMNGMLEKKKRLDKLYCEFENYREVMNDTDLELKDISMEEISNSVQLENKISERRRLLELMNIKDDKDIVCKSIEIRRRLYDIQPLWNDMNELRDLEMKVNDYDEKILKLGRRKDWISEEDLPRKILEWSSSKDLLTCPKCSTYLRFVSDRLVECPTAVSMEKMESMSKWIEDSKKRLEWIHEKSRLEEDMNSKTVIFETKCQNMKITTDELYGYPQLDESEKEKLIQDMTHLERVLSTYDDIFVSSDQLIRQKKKWEGSMIEKEIHNILEGYEEDIEDLDILEKEKERLIHERSRRIHFETLMEGLNIKLDGCRWNESLSEEGLKLLNQNLKKHEETTLNVMRSNEILNVKKKMENLEKMNVRDLLEEKRRVKKETKEKRETERREWEEAKEKIQLCENAETIEGLYEKMKTMRFESPGKIKDFILEKREEKEKCKQLLYQCEKAELLMEEKKKLESQRDKVIDLSNRVSVISMMKSMANELEHKRMVTILNTINDFANEILSILFDEPIKIEFMVYKMIKSKDKVKPSIVYKLLYRGYEMDHVDQLSGGEGDRVSLAVTCALFRFSKFPFLLLDEFASSLDLNTKEVAIKSLKTFLGIGSSIEDKSPSDFINGQKSILCISHDTVEGLYDDIVRL